MSGLMATRSGAASLVEVMMVFWGFLLILAAFAEFAHGQGRLAGRQEGTVRLQEAQRTAGMVLGAELRVLAESDFRIRDGEEMELRAFRGGGSVCSADDARVEVRYRGARRPDPEKDSVLLVGLGGEEVRDLMGTGETGCAGGGMTLVLDRPPAAEPSYAIVFESGSYHLVNGAVRYRLGGGGRQPLTETIFAAARFEEMEDGAVHLHLEPHPDSLRIGDTPPARLRLQRLNFGPP